jgi:hypothetical protein
MLIGGVLHQVVTRRTVQTPLVSVELVLLATIAMLALNVVITRTLSVLVTLEALRPARVALALFTTVIRESILIRLALVASQPGHASLAVALSRVGVTRRIETTDRVAVAVLAPIARHNVPESVFAFVALASDHIGLALAVA